MENCLELCSLVFFVNIVMVEWSDVVKDEGVALLPLIYECKNYLEL